MHLKIYSGLFMAMPWVSIVEKYWFFFVLKNASTTDGPTDGPTDRRRAPNIERRGSSKNYERMHGYTDVDVRTVGRTYMCRYSPVFYGASFALAGCGAKSKIKNFSPL